MFCLVICVSVMMFHFSYFIGYVFITSKNTVVFLKFCDLTLFLIYSIIYSSYVPVTVTQRYLSSETITALFKTRFRLDFPFDLQELPAFAILG